MVHLLYFIALLLCNLTQKFARSFPESFPRAVLMGSTVKVNIFPIHSEN